MIAVIGIRFKFIGQVRSRIGSAMRSVAVSVPLCCGKKKCTVHAQVMFLSHGAILMVGGGFSVTSVCFLFGLEVLVSLDRFVIKKNSVY